MHVETHIDEYLRGELPAEKAAEVERHLASCDRCREHMAWMRTLGELAAEVRIQHPPEIVESLEARLLSLPERLRHEERPVRRRPETRTRWLRPALQAAALLLVGLGVGWLARGGSVPGSADPAAPPALRAQQTAAGTARSREVELQQRVQELEEALLSTYLTRVEAALMHFVDDAAAGRMLPGNAGTYQDLLSLTANLKADSRSRGEERLGRLYAQVESVLMEIERLCRERDLPGARHVADVIEEQGLLSTLQRMKVGVE